MRVAKTPRRTSNTLNHSYSCTPSKPTACILSTRERATPAKSEREALSLHAPYLAVRQYGQTLVQDILVFNLFSPAYAALDVHPATQTPTLGSTPRSPTLSEEEETGYGEDVMVVQHFRLPLCLPRQSPAGTSLHQSQNHFRPFHFPPTSSLALSPTALAVSFPDSTAPSRAALSLPPHLCHAR